MTRRLSRRTIALVTAVLVLIVAAGVAVGVRPSTRTADRATTAPTSTSDDPATRGISVHRYAYLPAGVGDPRQDYGDLYLPAGTHADNTVPLVVLIHGGGWTARYSTTYMEPIARALAAQGVAVYNIEYRRIGSGGGWPTTFSDVAAAVDHVPTLGRLNPEIDTSDSTLVGHSAGAQLAVWVGTRNPATPREFGDPRSRWKPTRIISLAGPLNLERASNTGDTRVTRILGGTPAQVPDRYRAVDPIENIDPTMPITAVHGTADRVVSPAQSMSFVAAVQRARGEARLVLLRGQSHSALVSPRSSVFLQIIQMIAASTRPSA
ncbi:alpha/beta fold hydrolase [Williamsia sp.]|uniref:alpha/beta hydrolase family protein n=1 Tax=Williamsia sp. TaxID=1872085 RepID=UPI001A33329E|nr:alpha/beta fold hydrolase [Williamsia sp.]MBJ7290437.1 alpha/beta fold hydrolase [Williamsia sp.]